MEHDRGQASADFCILTGQSSLRRHGGPLAAASRAVDVDLALDVYHRNGGLLAIDDDSGGSRDCRDGENQDHERQVAHQTDLPWVYSTRV
ncbi:MAG: hypothetical protein ABFD96_19570 [Armatimonadia bacterium]